VMDKSEQINELAAALCKAQAEIEDAEKAKSNPAFRSRYADLGAVVDACKPALTKHGLAFAQMCEVGPEGTLCLTTVLMHGSGQWISGTCSMPLAKQDPQGYGSALTYARRYGLAAMVGVCPEDDDAQGAMPAQQAARQRFESRAQEVAHEQRAQARPESRGDQGAQRARAAVQAQEQPAASLVQPPAAASPPEGWGNAALGTLGLEDERAAIRALVDECEKAGKGNASILGGALSWAGNPDLSPQKAAKIVETLRGLLPVQSGNAYAPENR
jgi:hypothetical protein